MCSTEGRHSSQGQERVAQSLWAVGWAQADLTAWTQLIPHLKGKWRLRTTPVCASAAPQITSQPQSSYFPGSGRPGPFLSHPSVNKERTSQQIFVKSQSRLGGKELCQACGPQQTLGGRRPGVCTWVLASGPRPGCVGACWPSPPVLSSASRLAGQRADYFQVPCADVPTGPEPLRGAVPDTRRDSSTLSVV